jgi:hypothetical protein
MFRKMTLVLAATAALGAAALAPTSASAWGHHGWGWGGFGVGVGLGVVGSAIAANNYYAYNGYDSCLRRRVVDTYYGPRVRWVNVCY